MRLALLTPPVDPAFRDMTFPAYRHLVGEGVAPKLLGEAGAEPVRAVSLGLWEHGTPAGLSLVVLPLGRDGEPELLSVYVVRALRSRGFGKILVQAAEQTAREAGFASLKVTWTEGAPGSGWWEKVSLSRGWEPPQRRALSLLFFTEEVLRLPWLDRFPLREGCEIVPFSVVTTEEIEALRRSQEKKQWIASDLVPWRYLEAGFEERTSVALRTPDGIAGWVINHALSSQWLRFTCSYIRKDWGQRGRILPLFSASIHRMAEAGFVYGTFVAPAQHHTMVRFAERHVVPWVSRARWTLGSRKDLQCGTNGP